MMSFPRIAFAMSLSAFHVSVALARPETNVTNTRTGDSTLTILAAKNTADLTAVARRFELKRRKERACEIQRQAHLPPSLCYTETATTDDSIVRQSQLDAECRSFSLTSTEIPRTDRFTSAACRSALDKRAQDLAYVATRNASR